MKVAQAVADRKHVFVTGRAGSGKTATLAAVLCALDEAGAKYIATASTGIAAVPLEGTTLHSQLCLFEDRELKVCVRIAKGKNPLLKYIDVLVIDEISMVSEATLDMAYDILTTIRGGHDKLPVIVMVGDFFQLPPVKGEWAFKSRAWAALRPAVIDLPQSFRQKGEDAAAFLAALDEIRRGRVSAASARLLTSRLRKNIKKEYCKTREESGGDGGDGTNGTNGTNSGTKTKPETEPETATAAIKPTVLMSRRAAVDTINAREMAALVTEDNPIRTFVAVVDKQRQVRDKATDELVWVRCDGSLEVPGGSLSPALKGARVFVPPGVEVGCDEKSPQDSICSRFGHVLTPCELHVAVGAQVMFTANVAPPSIVNGSRGVVVGMDPATGFPLVQLVSGKVVCAKPFSAIRPIGRRHISPAYVFNQVPLMPAWAITFHKSQGMSLDLVEVDLGPSVWEKGQAYVALSRARTLAGLTILALSTATIWADPHVIRWHAEQFGAELGSELEPSVEDIEVGGDSD
jgi:hypothetical protein